MKMCSSRRRSRSNHPRRGFVLIVVMTMLTVAALYATGLARRSLKLALEASIAEEHLRQQWLRSSVQRGVISRADRIINQIAASTGHAEIDATVELNGVPVRFVIADEQAKANIDTLRTLNRRVDVTQVVSRFSSGTGLALNSQAVQGKQPLQSWGQVFLPTHSEFSQTPVELVEATRQLTLWGPGRINVNTADPEMLAFIVEQATNADVAGRLQEALQEQGRFSRLEPLLSRLALRAGQRKTLSELLDVTSSTYSVWTIPEAGAPAELHLVRFNNRRRSVEAFVW